MNGTYQCRICGNTKDNKIYKVKEKMFDLKDEFIYYQCSECGCLQILDYPSDMTKYYPSNYYSYALNKSTAKTKIVDFFIKHALSYRINGKDIMGYMSILYNRFYSENLPCFSSKRCNYDSKILDVGCGLGSLLLRLNEFGFKHLLGIDPFIDADIVYGNGVRIYKRSIYDFENEQFDCVMLHHSFEHMPEPQMVFEQLKKMLSVEGVLMIRIPLCDSYAWRKYGVDWWQLDAPRHFHLHTVKSVVFLAEKFGFRLEQLSYDSHSYQFIGSERYEGVVKSFDKRNMKYYNKFANLLNACSDGDQACFILKHK